MTKPIELIASTANWLSHATKTRAGNITCLIPNEELFDKFYDPVCYGVLECKDCPHYKHKNTTEIVNVLYRPFK